MRTLALLRHAKSSWDDPALADFDRPLAPRGLAAAPVIGAHMRRIGLAPDLVVCSPAVRTRETARLALDAAGLAETATIFKPTIYEASSDILLECLRRLGSEVRIPLLVGHNPGLQDLIVMLAGRRIPAEHAAIREKLPTAALVILSLPGDDWSGLGPGTATLVHVATPRSLSTGDRSGN